MDGLEIIRKGATIALLALATAGAFAKTAAFLPDKANTRIMVRGNMWQIQVGYNDAYLASTHAYSETRCEYNVIIMQSGLPYIDQRDSVLHELLHAGTCRTDGTQDILFYNSVSLANHLGLDRISSFMVELMHDNPELARYLIGDN